MCLDLLIEFAYRISLDLKSVVTTITYDKIAVESFPAGPLDWCVLLDIQGDTAGWEEQEFLLKE